MVTMFVAVAYAQNGSFPTVLAELMDKEHVAQAKADIAAFRQNEMENDEYLSEAELGFRCDTFAIEHFRVMRNDIDITDLGMRQTESACYDAYDALLNKYYKLLKSSLSEADQAVLLKSQRSWLAYRDNEFDLVKLLNKDEYSGGGTISLLIAGCRETDIVKDRVLKLAWYWISVSDMAE